MPKKYRSDALAAIHETMEALHDVGAINKQTMREFDEACLTPVHTLSPEEIKALRLGVPEAKLNKAVSSLKLAA
ncbi:MAG: DNA-binding protein [Gallionella sp.]|nr:DNA-binding protein [Gallionella sp.]